MIIKGGEVLEDTRAVDAVVVDKTGTITEGVMTVTEVCNAGLEPGERGRVQQLAASAEARSEHPIAQAIAASFDNLGDVENFRSAPGYGVTAVVDGTGISVGRRSLFETVPVEVESLAADAESRGSTAVLAGRANTAELVFVLADKVKSTSAEAVAVLHSQGLSVALLTGDNERTARSVAAEVGIGSFKGDDVIAEVYPDDKAAVITRLQQQNKRVAMVGDGINDAGEGRETRWPSLLR